MLTIRTHSLGAFNERLATVNKRLAKHGLPCASTASIRMEFQTRPHASWDETPDHVVDLDPTDDLVAARQKIFDSLEDRIRDLEYVVQVDVPAELLQWQGHVIRGRAQREEGGDLITRIGEHEADLAQYRGKPFFCAHCNAYRPRKSVWVFEREADGWLGSPKDKLKNLPVELVEIRAFNSDFGTRYFITFRDNDGHCLLWKTGDDPNTTGTWKQGTRLLLSGTIKGHTQWKGLKQTLVLRCKLVLDPSDPSTAVRTAA